MSHKTAPELYAFARSLLAQGKSSEAAAQALRIAVEREPSNGDYQAALGCACVMRLAAFTYAQRDQLGGTGGGREYERRHRIWQLTHSQPGWPLYGSPEPEQPSEPFTPDDSKPYTLSKEDGQEAIRRLGSEAQAAFLAARDHAHDGSPSAQLRRAYACGWGSLLIHRLAPDIQDVPPESPTPSEADQGLPQSRGAAMPMTAELEAVRRFRFCIGLVTNKPSGSDKHEKDAPSAADCWDSLAIALAPDFLDDWQQHRDSYDLGDSSPQTGYISEAKSAFEHAIAAEPNSQAILFQYAMANFASNPDRAAGLFDRIAQRDAGNALA